jgi:hypothetical protein
VWWRFSLLVRDSQTGRFFAGTWHTRARGVLCVRVRDGVWGAEAANVLLELVQVIREACAGGGGSGGGAAASPLPEEPGFPGPGPSPQPEVVMPVSSRSYG